MSSNKQRTSDDTPQSNDDFKTLLTCEWSQIDKDENAHEHDGTENGSRTRDIVLNLKQYIVDKSLAFEKSGYDKNIHLIRINENEGRFKQAADIAMITKSLQVTNL